MKNIYIIRHCEAEGQPPKSTLTDRGVKQSSDLACFFDHIKVERIISSPYKRAIETIQPLANQLNVEIETDNKLKERILSTTHLSDWFQKLRATYEDMNLKFEGGESSQEAMNRIVEVIEGALKENIENTIIVTHGNIMSLLLNHYDKEFGFDEWNNLSNPDVFLLNLESNKVTYKRLWEQEIVNDFT